MAGTVSYSRFGHRLALRWWITVVLGGEIATFLICVGCGYMLSRCCRTYESQALFFFYSTNRNFRTFAGGDCCAEKGKKFKFNYCTKCVCRDPKVARTCPGKKECGARKFLGDGRCDPQNNNCGCNWDGRLFCILICIVRCRLTKHVDHCRG